MALTIIWFCLLLLIPGGVTLLVGVKRGRITYIRGWSEFIFLSFLGSFFLLSIFGLITAQLEIFSIPLVAGLLLGYSFLILIFFRPALSRAASVISRKEVDKRGWRGAVPPLVLLLIMVLAGVLFLRPTEYIFGGWDPGVYVNTAVHIERTGSIKITDSRPAVLSPEEQMAFSRKHSSGYREKYPGFRRTGRSGGILIPQFYHLFPVLLAFSYLPDGLRGMFYLAPVLGLFSLLAVYLAVREFWDRVVALAATFLLAVNLVEIWQARLPTAEILSQFLLFSGLFMTARYIKKGEVYMAWLGGSILGLLMLSRISALLIWAPLALFFYLRWFVSFRRKDFNLLLPLLILTGYSLLPHLLYGAHYAAMTINNFFPSGWWWLGIPFVTAVGVVWLRLAPVAARERILSLVRGRTSRWIILGGVIALACYGYFIRPALPTLSADRTNLVELGWLLTLPGLILGLLGICLLIRENRRDSVWLFLLITLIFAGIFLWRQLIHPYYMWAARRFAVVTIPGFLICAAWTIVRLGRSRPRFSREAAVVIFLLLIFCEISAGRVVFAHREYRGAAEFMDKVAGRVRGADLVIVEGRAVDKLPTPLELTYGLTVLPVYGNKPNRWPILKNIIRRMKRDRAQGVGEDPVVYLLTDQNPGPDRRPDLLPGGNIFYHAVLFERSGDHLPGRLDDQAPDGTIALKIFQVVLE